VVANPPTTNHPPLPDPGSLLRRNHRTCAATPGVNPADTWALLCGAKQPVRVNGLPVPLGLTVLSDRDEIRLPRFFARFSTETQAHVEPFPESATRGFCPRCKQRIEAGTPAVCCPSCGLWHHASADLPCWSYAPTCAACVQRTAMDAGFRWTPEDL